MKDVEAMYRCLPFWSWNDELEPDELVKQIDWMHENGVGGFFMHARGGLTTPYLGEKWFDCVAACEKEAKKLGMEAYAYDENGWPSGFAGGKLLEDPNNRDHYLTFSYGPYDPNAMVSYNADGDALIRVTSGDNVLNIYDHIATSTADILNKEVVDKFIALTHEEYKKRDKDGLKGFFTDEPQYYRWGTSYTRVLPSYFKEHYNYDLLDGIGLLFVKKEGYREFRYRYWKAMQDLMIHAFAKNIYEWCDKNSYKLTGHYVEETSLYTQMWCCAGIMPLYEYEHIPGVDWLGRYTPDVVSPKQVGSVASQLGKKQVLSEMFACDGWDVTPIELKRDAEALYWGGVNLMCQHLMPYSEHGQRKRDYPAHYSPVNPWVKKGFKAFNDYFAILGKYLSNSEEIVDVAVLNPIRSAYFDYTRDESVPSCGIEEVELPFHELTEKLTAMHISWHFVDETLLAKYGKVENGKLVCGKKSYSILVFPKVLTMDKTTETLLREFVKQGGKISLPYGKPTYLEGQPYDYSYLKENIDLEGIRNSMPFKSSENANIRLSYRKNDDGEFLYLVNVGKKEDIVFERDSYTSFESLDLLKDEKKVLPLSLHFEEGESKIVFFSNKEVPEEKKKNEIHLGKFFHIESPVMNYLTIDKVAYSLDGVNYSKPHPHMGVFFELLEKRFAGDLHLKYVFDVKKIPSKCLLEIEDSHTISVTLNGKELTSASHVEFEPKLKEYDAMSSLKIGENEVIVKMHYYQGENVYYALFGENVTESLKNCLAYDSDIEPIYVKGDFGVYGDFHDGSVPGCVIGNNFYIDDQKKDITHLIEDGFPFFKGDIVLDQDIDVEDADSVLVIDKRFQLLDIECNGKKVPSAWYDSRFDLSGFLTKGKNHLRITLTVSPRNLMGPHHSKEEEDMGVGPYTFERVGTWVDCESPYVLPTYAFVRTIL